MTWPTKNISSRVCESPVLDGRAGEVSEQFAACRARLVEDRAVHEIGVSPLSIGHAFASFVQDRWHARLYFLGPILCDTASDTLKESI
jgi:hypothetical protein